MERRVLAVLEAGPSGIERGALAAGALAQRLASESGAAADLLVVGPCSRTPGRWDRCWQADARDVRALSEAAACLCGRGSYLAVLLGDTPLGRELCARLAVRLDAPVVSPLLSVRTDQGALRAIVPAKAGAATATFDILRTPLLGVVDSGAANVAAAEAGTPPALERLPVDSRPDPFEHRGEERLGPWEMDVTEADVIVAGGRGVGPEGFEMLAELATLLGGTVGASRVAVDLGWAPYARQIGLTGKTVAPRLYVACGISGAIHHTLGMRDSAFVVAINTDPNAPIFKLANTGIVGDVRDVVPSLIEELRARRTPEPLAAAGGAA